MEKIKPKDPKMVPYREMYEKINEIVEWINTQQSKIDLQDQYKQ